MAANAHRRKELSCVLKLYLVIESAAICPGCSHAPTERADPNADGICKHLVPRGRLDLTYFVASILDQSGLAAAPFASDSAPVISSPPGRRVRVADHDH